jgi:hypothetical protein
MDVQARGAGDALALARAEQGDARLQAGGGQELPDDAEAADQAPVLEPVRRARGAGSRGEISEAMPRPPMASMPNTLLSPKKRR